MNRLLRIAALCAVAFMLGACGKSETEQRQAFIGFLQNDVLAKPALRVPALNEERRAAFGDYAAQYEIITRFHDTMNGSVSKPLQDAISRAAPTSLQDLVSRRADIVAVRASLAKVREALDGATATAEKERAALKQPDDLAPVYRRAYDKLVTEPNAVVREVLPVTDDALASAIALADVIDKNRAAIKLEGSSVQIKDQALLKKFQATLDAMNRKREAINAAVGKMRRLVSGG